MCLPETLAAMNDPQTSRRNWLKYSVGAIAAAAAMTVTPAGAAAVKPTRFSQVADLTHLLGPNFPLFPNSHPFEIKVAVAHKEDGYYGNIITYWEHTGTHLDAPVHFKPDALYVDQIAPQSLILPAAVIDISGRAARDPDTVVTPDDIRAWESRYGRLPANAAVLMHSGWAARVGSTASYRNADSSGTMHFPGFGKPAIDFLLTERSVAAIGVDTLSLDPGTSPDFAVHNTFLPTNRYGIENLANLDAIPPSGSTLIVGAPKIASGSGGPGRVMAVW